MSARNPECIATALLMTACQFAFSADEQSGEPRNIDSSQSPRTVLQGNLSGRALSIEVYDSKLLVFELAKSERVSLWAPSIDNSKAYSIRFDRDAIALSTEGAHHGLYRTTFRLTFHLDTLKIVRIEREAIESGSNGDPMSLWHGEKLDLLRSRAELWGKKVDDSDEGAAKRASRAFASGGQPPPAGASRFTVKLRKTAPIPVASVDLLWPARPYACAYITEGLRLAHSRDADCLR